MKQAPDFAKPILFLLGVTLTSLAFAQDSTQMVLEQARVELRRAVQEGRVAGAALLVLRDGKTIYSEAAGLSDIGDKTPFKAEAILSVSQEKRARFTACLTVRDGKFAALDPVASSPFNDCFEFLSGGGPGPTLPDFAGRQFATIDEGLNSGANAATPSPPL